MEAHEYIRLAGVTRIRESLELPDENPDRGKETKKCEACGVERIFREGVCETCGWSPD